MSEQMTNEEIRLRLTSILMQMDEIGMEAIRAYVLDSYKAHADNAKNVRLTFRGRPERDEDVNDQAFWKDHEARMMDSLSRAYFSFKKMQDVGRILVNPPDLAPLVTARAALNAARAEFLNLPAGAVSEWALHMMDALDALAGGKAE